MADITRTGGSVETFGKFLVRKGVLSQHHLEETVQAMVVVGGRLGINLLESGHLGIEALDGYLAEHLGVPVPPNEWLAEPSREALAAVPAEVAKRHMILPLAVEGRTLHVALADPRDANLVDEIAFAAGLTLQPYALTEVHLSRLREQHLGIGQTRRFSNVDDEWSFERKRRTLASDSKQGSPASDDDRELHEGQTHGILSLEAEEDLMDEGTFSTLHSKSVTGDPPAEEEPNDPIVAADRVAEESPSRSNPFEGEQRSPLDIALLEQELAEAPDREAIGDHALRLACTHTEAAALFLVHGEAIRGWCASGNELGARIAHVILPVSADSVLTEVAVSRADFFRGSPPSDGIDGQVFSALDRNEAREVAILPVRIRDRVVNLLYVDNGVDALGDNSLIALRALCESMSRAYERLIISRRQSYC